MPVEIRHGEVDLGEVKMIILSAQLDVKEIARNLG